MLHATKKGEEQDEEGGENKGILPAAATGRSQPTAYLANQFQLSSHAYCLGGKSDGSLIPSFCFYLPIGKSIASFSCCTCTPIPSFFVTFTLSSVVQ
ncbi:hypothetical protein V6N12_045240 [Hibiscus sabdariffa]|uniref:Uncharacterized protein n=1 Tax=Hibiscus sabdariffa TaxID=183260 RepID=A0ABR2G2X4_9ROSI